MKTKIVFQGLEQSFKATQTTKRNDGVSLSNSLLESAHVVLAKADTFVPIDNGDLQSTGHVEGNGFKGFLAQFSVNYGGPSQISDKDVDYAVIVHERTDLDTNRTPPRGSKYVQRAVNATRKQCSRIVNGKFLSKETTVSESGLPFVVGGDKWHG